MAIKTRIVKEFSLEEKASKLQAELNEAAEKEKKEVTDFIIKYMTEKGYGISARVVFDPNEQMQVLPYVFKVKK